MMLTDGLRAIALASVVLAAGFAWMSIRAWRITPASPDRLLAALRLAQFASLVLVFTAGAYVGFAVLNERVQGAGLDVALAVGFLLTAASQATRDPREALPVLALAFAAHAVVDTLHRPGLLPATIAPRWYIVGCAIYNLLLGALCYLPILRR